MKNVNNNRIYQCYENCICLVTCNMLIEQHLARNTHSIDVNYCGKQNTGLLKMSISQSLVPVNVWCCMTKESYGADGIKAAHWLTLRWRWLSWISLLGPEWLWGAVKVEEEDVIVEERYREMQCGQLWDGGRWPWAKEWGQPLKVGKDRGVASVWRVSRKEPSLPNP